MDQSWRRADVLQRKLRVLNQKEDRNLQHKLSMLDKQYRYTRKMLQNRKDTLANEHRRVMMLKVCEPKATVNIAMEEIRELNNTERHFRGLQTSGGRTLSRCEVLENNRGSDPGEQSRSISAPPAPVKATTSVRHRGNIQSSLSLMQMKNIATIDSILEKELAREQQRAQEEMERLRQFQREAVHKRVTTFVEKLKEKINMQLMESP